MSAARSFAPAHHATDPGPRFVSERDLEGITGISMRTWQKHRLFSTGPRYYKVGSAVRYRLDEVLDYIQSRAVEPGSR